MFLLVGCTTNTQYSEEGFIYNLINDGQSYAIVGFEDDYYNRKIPDEYNGLPVTELDTSALENSQMESIYIGKNIEVMGWYVFSNCVNLKKITVDKNNKSYISKDNVLYNIDMTELVCYPSSLNNKKYELPSTVQSLGYFAFENNKYLEEVTLNSNITIIEGSCFYKAKNLKVVHGMENVKEITRYAFYNCEKLADFTLPTNLSKIGSYAFANCTSLSKLTISKNVESIGNDAFIGCSNLTITCELSRRPQTWNRDWNGGTKVIWG